ncbi:MAG: hypothetical protein EOO43_16260, partial [Flavobacterium sp.]
MINDLISMLQEGSFDNDDRMKKTAVESILELTRIDGDTNIQLLRKIASNFVSLLTNNNEPLLMYCISEIVKINDYKDSELLDCVIPTLIPYIQDNPAEFERLRRDALSGITDIVIHISKTHIQLTQDFLVALTRLIQNQTRPDLGVILVHVESIMNVCCDIDATVLQNIMSILVAFGDSHGSAPQQIFKIITDALREKCSDESKQQLIVDFQNSLNQRLEGSPPYFRDNMIRLMIKLAEMFYGTDIKQGQALLAPIHPFLKHDDIYLRQEIFCLFVGVLKKNSDQDSPLTQDLMDALSSIVKEANGKLLPTTPGTILDLLKISGNEDKTLIKEILLALIPYIKYVDENRRYESVNCMMELLKMYGKKDTQFVKEILNEIISVYDKANLEKIPESLQKLSVTLLSDVGLPQEYLNHPNVNIRRSLLLGVAEYFIKYLERFEILDELVASETSLTIEEINERLFDNLLDVEVFRKKINSDYLIQTKEKESLLT